MRAQRVAVAAVAVSAATLALATPGQAATASHPTRVRVPNIQPSLAGAKRLGAAPAGQTVSVRLYLGVRDAAGLPATVKAVSDPHSSQYGRYLTPSQVRARYAPDAATVAAVRSFLTGYGLKVTAVPSNHLYVDAAGTVAHVQQAFGAPLSQFTKDGSSLRATTASTTVPSALAGKVIAISGLSSRTARVTPAHVDGPKIARPSRAALGTQAAGASRRSAPPPSAFVNAPPCSAYWAQKIATTLPSAYGQKQPYAPCGYVPAQIQGTYGLGTSLAAGFDGRGVTVAITDAYAAPTILADATTYATRHGQRAFRTGQFRQVLPPSFNSGYDSPPGPDHDICGEQGWYGEETLDVEAVHAVAPGANVTYVASASCFDDDFLAALNTIVDKRLASIVTNSWGGLDEGAPEYTDLYQQVFYLGALEGIGFYFSSGDNGDSAAFNNGVPTANAPANSPLVTAVGGTSLAVSAGSRRLWETGWSTGKSTLTNGAWTPAPPGPFLYGAGGGTSRVFSQPWYQQGVVPDSLSMKFSDQPGRVVPDVATVGDPNTGFLIGETQTFPDGSVRYSEYRIGGTSLSSPVFAGVMAIADQISGRPHGFANPALYSLYGTRAYYDPRHVSGVGVVRVDYVNGVDASGGTTTSLRTLDSRNGTTLRTTPGYDDITGVGTPNGTAFLAALGVVH